MDKKTQPTYMLPQETHLGSKDTQTKSKGMEKYLMQMEEKKKLG